MSCINRHLCQMESMYSTKPVDTIFVSDYIHNLFENKEYYEINNELLTEEWFSEFSEKNIDAATEFVGNCLAKDNKKLLKKNIIEGIVEYNKGFEYA